MLNIKRFNRCQYISYVIFIKLSRIGIFLRRAQLAF